MAVTNTTQAVFIVWTTKDLFVEYIMFDKQHWEKVKNNLDIFFECTYVLLYWVLNQLHSVVNVMLCY